MLSLCRINLLILLLLSFILGGCSGYRLVTKPDYLQNYSTIYIPPWTNYTSEPKLGELLAYYLRLKFSEGSFLIPVFDKKKADLILKGKVRQIYFEPVSYDTFLKTKERKISFRGDYELIDRHTGKVIFKKSISRYQIYRVLEDVGKTLDPGRQEALRLLAQDVSELIFQALFLDAPTSTSP